MASKAIMHYASPYYDPVKAHEYYEEHKKLKGRHSTAGLNDKGRETAAYVKEQLLAEKKRNIEQSKNTMTSTIKTSRTSTDTSIKRNRESAKSMMESHKAQTQRKIDSIGEQIKSMSSEDRRGPKGEALREQISELRESNKQKRETLNAALRTLSTQLRTKHKTTSETARSTHMSNVEKYKNEYDTKLEKELANIRSDKSMVNKKKK